MCNFPSTRVGRPEKRSCIMLKKKMRERKEEKKNEVRNNKRKRKIIGIIINK